MDKEASTCNSITVSPIICDGIFHKALTRECEKENAKEKYSRSLESLASLTLWQCCLSSEVVFEIQ